MTRLGSLFETIKKTGVKSFPTPGNEEGYLLFISLAYVWFGSVVAHRFLHLNYNLNTVHVISGLFLTEIIVFRYLLANPLREKRLSMIPYLIEPSLVVLFVYSTGGMASLFLPLVAIYLLLVYQFAAGKALIVAIADILITSIATWALEAVQWLPLVQPFLGEKGPRFVASYYQATFMILGVLFLLGWIYSRYFKKAPAINPTRPANTAANPFGWDKAEQLLSGRELEVVREAFNGLTNKEIADKFVIQEDTVKSHLNRAYKKLQVKNRVQLIKYFSSPEVVSEEKNNEE